MKKTKKALASLAIAGMVLSMAPASVFAADANRIEGADRYATSIKIAEKAYSSATTAVIAAGNPNNLVDALAAAPLAAQEKAPIYLTDKADMNDSALASLKKLGVTKVIVVGAAASDAVVKELKDAGLTVDAVKGAGRVETAEAINAKLTAPKGTIVVGYNGVADAMSVASYAAANGYKIVVAKADGTTAATSANYVIGGPTLVKDIAGAERIYGADRYDTNKKVLETLTFGYDTVYVANGATLADALVASVLAAQTKSPIALSNGSSVQAANTVNAKLTKDSMVVALGGTGVVSASALDSVKYQAPVIKDLAVESVSVLNAQQIQVKFNKAVDEAVAETSSNYKIYDKAGSTVAIAADNAGTSSYGAVLQDDDQTVVITLAAAISTKTDLTVVVTKSIFADADNSEYAPLYSTVVTVADKTAPTVKKVESKTKDDSTDKVTITFDEPVTAAIKIDGKAVNGAVWSNHNTKVVVTTVDKLDSATSHKLEVVNATDGANNVNTLISQTFNITKDTNAPTIVGVSQYSDQKVLVKFSKKMTASTLTTSNIKAVDSSLVAAGPSAVAAEANDTTGTEFVVTLSGVSYTSDKKTQTYTLSFSDSITDSLGNELDAVTKQVTLTKDETAPAVDSVKVVKDSTGKVTRLEVKFNEAISAANIGNLVVVDKNGVEVTSDLLPNDVADPAFALDSVSGKTVKLALTPATKLVDKYTLTFKKGFAKDASIGANDNSSYTTTVDFGAADAEKFELTGTPVGNPANNKFTVNFGRQVKGGDVTGSATNPSRYTVNGSTLPAGSTITLNTARDTATIIMPSSSVSASDNSAIFTIIGVQDLDGNTIVPYTTTVAVVDNIKPVLQSASLFSYSNANPYTASIILEFNEDMTVVGAGTDVSDELAIKVGGTDKAVTAAAAYVVPGKNKQIRVDFTFATALDTNKTITVKTVDGDGGVRDTSVLNNEAKADVTVTVTK